MASRPAQDAGPGHATRPGTSRSGPRPGQGTCCSLWPSRRASGCPGALSGHDLRQPWPDGPTAERTSPGSLEVAGSYLVEAGGATGRSTASTTKRSSTTCGRAWTPGRSSTPSPECCVRSRTRTRRHLARHAAEGAVLDELVQDADFVLGCDSGAPAGRTALAAHPRRNRSGSGAARHGGHAARTRRARPGPRSTGPAASRGRLPPGGPARTYLRRR